MGVLILVDHHSPTETDQQLPLQKSKNRTASLVSSKFGGKIQISYEKFLRNLDDGNNLTIFVLEHVSLSKVFHVEDIKYHSRVTNMVLLITENLQVSKNPHQFLFELHITSINNITTLLKSVIY